MRPSFKEVNMNILLDTALKHSTWNSFKGDLRHNEGSLTGMDVYRHRKPFTESRQLFNKDMILNAVFSDQDKTSVSVFFNKEVFIVLTAPLHTHFHHILESGAGFHHISGDHRSVINTIVGGYYTHQEEVYDKGEWLKFGNRKLLSSYQAIANYLINNDLHPKTVKSVYLPTVTERKPQNNPVRWKVDESVALFSMTTAQMESYKGRLPNETFHIWSDDKIFFITEKLLSSGTLPPAFVRTEANTGPVWGQLFGARGKLKDHQEITGHKSLKTYLNDEYDN